LSFLAEPDFFCWGFENIADWWHVKTKANIAFVVDNKIVDASGTGYVVISNNRILIIMNDLIKVVFVGK
jgi:hypothetical protein